MSLNFMMDTLQRISNGKIVLLKMGAFYIAKGRDAVLLNKLLKWFMMESFEERL